MEKIRYEKLDGIRGIALLNMVAYHAIWDLVYMYHFDWGWYQSRGGYIWQQGICWTFIFLSGFCLRLGKHPLKRGIVISAGGVVITVATLLVMPENRVVFGVLTLIGSCMLIVAALDKWLRKLPSVFSLAVSTILFFITRNVNIGCLGFEKIKLLKLPKVLYANLFTTYLGFPKNSFFSTDYFSLFPWIFLFMSGYFLSGCFIGKRIMNCMRKSLFLPIEWIGKHSFVIYLLHQPVLYIGMEFFM